LWEFASLASQIFSVLGSSGRPILSIRNSSFLLHEFPAKVSIEIADIIYRIFLIKFLIFALLVNFFITGCQPLLNLLLNKINYLRLKFYLV